MRKKFAAKDGTEVIFREPKLSDAKQLMNMINEVCREKHSGINRDRPVTLKEEKKWLKGVISDIKKKGKVMLVVEVNGKIRGNSEISRKSGKCKHRGYFGIMLNKEIRGKGIGKALMKEVINLAKKRMKGLEIIELDVFEYNKRAQNLYKKLGFKKVAEIPYFAKEGRKYFSSYLMQLYLKKNLKS